MTQLELCGHEVHQVLLEILQGTRNIARVTTQSWAEVYCGLIVFNAGGWMLTFYNDCASLDYCEIAVAPDGRAGSFDTWYDKGEEPVSLLDAAERLQLESLLNG